MFNRSLVSFMPSVYDGVVEIQDIINAEENEMDIARREMSAAFANTFVSTANESGIVLFEKMLGITANLQTENLEFRRDRVMNRLAMSPPFTFRFLKQKLDEIIGVGAWASYIDFSNYTLYVEASATDQNWYTEVEFTVGRVKPCNMVFVSVPRTSRVLNLSEEIHYSNNTWRYRLGSWKLGEYSFSTFDGGGIIKMADTKSIQPPLLNDAANFVASDIAKVIINDSITITEFRLKQVSDNVVSIEYVVSSNMVDTITDIKLLRSDGTVLTQSVVYVPVTDTVINKHVITIKEGV